ncbi:ABC transporter permease [Myroides sp. LJL119]
MTPKSNSNNRLALQKFKSNFWGVLSFWIIIALSIVSLTAYLFIPDDSQNANNGHLELHSKPPGFKIDKIHLPVNQNKTLKEFFTGKDNPESTIPIESFHFTKDTLFYVAYGQADTLGIALNNWPYTTKKHHIVKPTTYYLGTDSQGRDFFSRLVLGSRVSISIGFIAVSISLLVGITLGSLAGYYGGKIDMIIQWIINIFWSIPTLLLVIAITLALGKGFYQVFIAVGLTMWVEVARVVRGQIISLKQQQYITASKALGYSDYRIVTKHILPNIMAPVIVISAANFASAILMESGLSFLGIGTQIPTPSWGAMIKENYNYILLGKAYLALLPGFAMFLLVISFMLLGNALRDALDVKSN